MDCQRRQDSTGFCDVMPTVLGGSHMAAKKVLAFKLFHVENVLKPFRGTQHHPILCHSHEQIHRYLSPWYEVVALNSIKFPIPIGSRASKCLILPAKGKRSSSEQETWILGSKRNLQAEKGICISRGWRGAGEGLPRGSWGRSLAHMQSLEPWARSLVRAQAGSVATLSMGSWSLH